MDDEYVLQYRRESPEHLDVVEVALQLVNLLGGRDRFLTLVGKRLRCVYDDVIKMPKTGRWSVTQLDKTEKTYIGTAVEIEMRHLLRVRRGQRLDLALNDLEVDVKNTIRGSSWEIPREAVGELCLVIASNDSKGLFSIGLVRAMPSYLSLSPNQDKKRKLSIKNKAIFWIAQNEHYPENFFESLPSDIRDHLLSAPSGMERIRRAFRTIQGRILSRETVEGLGQQKDPLKRVRRNGGAPDLLGREGIYIFSGKSLEPELARDLGFPCLRRDEFVSLCADEIRRRVGKVGLERVTGRKNKKLLPR